jgi:hypothetical protein
VKLSRQQYELATLAGFGGTGAPVSAADFDGDGKADPTLLETAGSNFYQVLNWVPRW